ncbi:amino acid ABC transporter permease [Deltaproteobacteria bacterium Smac51]|nr:amino acid ABC transporter permease [Deltaproteobacteria bacterium Smac51]
MNNEAKIPPQLRRHGWRPFDSAALILIIGVMIWMGWRVLIHFNYPWDWSVIPQFIVSNYGGSLKLGTLGLGLLMTLKLSLWASALGLFFGLLLALARLSRSLYLRLISRTAVEVCRNIPPLVLVFIAFYFLSAQLLPWPYIISLITGISPLFTQAVEFLAVDSRQLGLFFPAVMALGFYEAAYFSEILRGAIISMNKGQWEASYCLGLSRFQQYRFVILPQVFRKSAPQLAGQFISTVKESSIVSVISLAELTYSGQQLSATIHKLFEVWLTVAALYFIFNFALSCLFRRFERRQF